MAATFDNEMPEAESKFVLTVLDMYRALTPVAPGDDGPQFPGFDGNEEGRLLSFAKFFTETMGRYQEITQAGKGPIPNRHAPTIQAYRAMITEWKRAADPHHPTAEELERILEEAP